MSSLQPALSLLAVLSQEEARFHLDEISGPETYTPEESQALWKASVDAYNPVHDTPGIPEILEFPSSIWDHLLTLHEHESLPAVVDRFRWSARLVEIDALFSIAIDIFIPRVEYWVQQLSGVDLPGITKACLPNRAALFHFNLSPPSLAYVIHSDLGATWGYDLKSGTLSPTLVKPPLPVRAVEIAGRLYLMDGYHRAVALRRLGYKHVPCLIIHDCNWMFLRTTPRQRRFEPAPFARPTPPCVGHFLTPAAVCTRAKRLVRVMTMRVESFIAPLTELEVSQEM